MLNQTILEALPNDPEEALSILEHKLRNGLPLPEDQGDYDEQRRYDTKLEELRKQYVITLGAFASLHNLEVGVEFDTLILLESLEFDGAFRAASYKLQFFADMCAFKLNARVKSGSTCVYVLSDAAKIRIRKQIDNIKKVIDEAEISDTKRDSLFTKINSFAEEVDKDRTRIESLASAYVAVRGEAKVLSKVLEPIEKVFEIVSSGGRELWKALPEIKITARLEPPQKKLSITENLT